MMAYSLILLAAGSGKRMKLGYNKMFYKIEGKEIIYYTLKNFLKDEMLNDIVLVISEEDREYIKNMLLEFHEHLPKIKIAYGGKERQDSVYNGLKMIEGNNEIVVVHDGARPFFTLDVIHKSIKKASEFGIAIVGTKVIDTLKKVENEKILGTVDRNNLWAVQTPQTVKHELLQEVHSLAKECGFYGTDEAVLIEKYTDITPIIVEGSYDNVKITTKEQLELAKFLVNKYFKEGVN